MGTDAVGCHDLPASADGICPPAPTATPLSPSNAIANKAWCAVPFTTGRSATRSSCPLAQAHRAHDEHDGQACGTAAIALRHQADPTLDRLDREVLVVDVDATGVVGALVAAFHLARLRTGSCGSTGVVTVHGDDQSGCLPSFTVVFSFTYCAYIGSNDFQISPRRSNVL